jgi:cytochrome c oxidase subunit 2
MIQDAPLFPVGASTHAEPVDTLFLALCGIGAFFTLLIAVLIVVLGIRYRRRRAEDVGRPVRPNLALELFWSGVPLVIVFGIYGWGASVFFRVSTPPDDALRIAVVGKQWMWKFQHPDGAREINELHVPVGRPVVLTMTSEDVIHSLFVPAFRVKMDVVPGRYTTLWFEATKPGEFHLFCAEYCGTSHSLMRGRVVVLDPTDYGTWLAGHSTSEAPSALGRRIVEREGCLGCHVPGGGERGSDLAGLFGRDILLADGTRLRADESYVRESIVRPGAKLVAGFAPLMPSYQGRLGEEDLLRVIAYLKTLGDAP